MRTTERIGFKLIIKEPDTAERTIVVCPRYDGLKMKWQRESGKVYHTLDFEGNLEFWGVDFVTLLNCQLRTVFELVVFLKGRGEVGRSEFRKTDCEWNLNDGWCKVDISTYDKYSKINDNKDDEYNVVNLGIEKRKLSLYLYPNRQVYFMGDDKISQTRQSRRCVQYGVTPEERSYGKLGNMGFNVPMEHNNDDANVIGVVKIETVPWGDMQQFIGTYYTTQNYFEDTGETFGRDRVYAAWMWKDGNVNSPHRIQIYCRVGNGAGATRYRLNFYNIRTLVASTSIGSFMSDLPDTSGWNVSANIFIKSTKANFWFSNGNIAFTGKSRFYLPMSRLLIPIENLGVTLKSDDITANNNRNHKSSLPVGSQYVDVRLSTRTSDDYTEYGIVENTNKYYAPPTDDEKWVPAMKESWFEGFSVWVGDNRVSNSHINNLRRGYDVYDFYLFTDAVRAVIQKIDPTIVFNDGDSHFLTDATNPVSGNPQCPLYISQKSNVLNLGYDYPAWQAPVKWSQIETFLKNALGCYWDLYEDANGVTHLRIEHQSFYDNGGTYNPQGNPSATIDLLHNRFDVATRQPQAFHTNRWKWDVDSNGLYSSACRYEYGWMDTQSAIFDGETVEVPEEYRLFTDDKTEERKVDWFSSDIDFLTAVQAECSSDGFVVVMESYTNPGWIVSGHENYSGQNYQLSFEYLQPLYLVYGIYAEKVQIGDGNTAYDTGSHARMRTSEVSFNLLEGEWAEPRDVLITEVGEGVIDTLTYDMSSEKWTATVRYNNE